LAGRKFVFPFEVSKKFFVLDKAPYLSDDPSQYRRRDFIIASQSLTTIVIPEPKADLLS
jgi:hypothetical protein